MSAVLDEYMSIWNHPGEWTEEDFLALPHGAPKIELIDGRLLVSPAARKAHQQVMRRLANIMEATAPDELAVEVELNVRVGPTKILIPDVVATRELDGGVLVHDPEHILLVAEVLSPSNRGQEWIGKNHLYAAAGIEWYLLVELDESAPEGEPFLILQRLNGGVYAEVARAGVGEVLELPEPFGAIDPASLLKRRP